MKWANSLWRWTMRSIHGMILGASFLGAADLAFGQTAALKASAVKLPPQVYSRYLGFELPITLAENWRAKVSEFQMYSKTPTTDWKPYKSGSQSLQKFDCKVAQDGEYWYTLITIDLAGKATPADMNAEPPSLRVVVDTTRPVITVEGEIRAGSADELCVRCAMHDTNPDPSSLRAAYRTDDGDVPLDPVPNQPGLFRLKGPDMMRFPLVIVGTDLAKNTGSKEVSVRELLSEMQPTPPPSALRMNGTSLPPPRMDSLLLIAKSDAPVPVEPSAKFEPMKVDMPERNIPFTVQRVERPVAPGLPDRVETPNPLPLNLTVHTPIRTEPNFNVPAAPPLPVQAPVSVSRGTIPYQLINTTHASVDYRIDRKGPSGVGKVEIYMTPDKGQTWHRLGEHADERSPANIILPGDDVFGIRIVITNGSGFGGRAPVRGDSAHCEIEVDTTSPFVQLRSADLMPSTGQIEVRWNANDRNFGNAPISLFYRTQIDSPWQVVARGLKNDGLYRWAFPRENNAQFFFKIEAMDQAGNVAHDVTRQPLVIDVSEPSVSVIGVTGSRSVGIRPVQLGN